MEKPPHGDKNHTQGSVTGNPTAPINIQINGQMVKVPPATRAPMGSSVVGACGGPTGQINKILKWDWHAPRRPLMAKMGAMMVAQVGSKEQARKRPKLPNAPTHRALIFY